MSVNEQELEEHYQTWLKGNALAKHVNEEPLTLGEFATLLRIRGYSNCNAADFLNWLIENKYVVMRDTGDLMPYTEENYFGWQKQGAGARTLVVTVEGQDFFLDKFASGEFKICCCGGPDRGN